jgi:hypothetical protein
MEPRARGSVAGRGESGHALVMWAKVPGAARAAKASGRPAPYNAIGRSTRGEAAAPDVVFDLSHLLP